MRERGLFEFLDQDKGVSRRHFLSSSVQFSLAASAWRLIGLHVPMARFAPLGLFPVTSFAAEPGSLVAQTEACLLYTSPSPRDQRGSRMPSSA